MILSGCYEKVTVGMWIRGVKGVIIRGLGECNEKVAGRGGRRREEGEKKTTLKRSYVSSRR